VKRVGGRVVRSQIIKGPRLIIGGDGHTGRGKRQRTQQYKVLEHDPTPPVAGLYSQSTLWRLLQSDRAQLRGRIRSSPHRNCDIVLDDYRRQIGFVL
jgi:hypothetical protein